MTDLERFGEIVKTSKRIVFFGGAGVSTESGIPDFRSVDGLYHTKYQYPPETILSHTFFMRKTEEFFKFYREKMLFPKAEPNVCHRTLAKLEAEGKLLAIVTQNIDGLHQKAGNKRVFELHGSVHRNTCMKCGKKFGLDHILNTTGVPSCSCGGIVKPDVVLYEEPLDEETIEGAVHAIASADTLVIGGTSLAVYPAAGLVDYFRGDHLIVINLSPTDRDSYADLVLSKKIGEVFSSLGK